MSKNSATPYFMFHQMLQNLSRLALAIVMAVGSFTIWSVSNAALSQVYAATPEKIGTFRYWRVYQLGIGVNKVCYMLSEPVEKLPRNVRRGKIYFSIMHHPANGVRNEASVSVGYPFSAKSNPYARIGTDSFDFDSGVQMEADPSWAWLRNPAHHDRLIDMMKRGNQLVFKGTSARGTLTTDTYSLLGFSKALARLNQACPAP
ncbi:invasion associated locus B family protein [Candidatus Micropelagos thuwalensis]|nr:invasion associated locus B family protein [Candidatus Micropelagos thuwalensis]